MDFRHQITSPGALAGVSLERSCWWSPAMRSIPRSTLRCGARSPMRSSAATWKLKKGRRCYVHRPAGLKAARLVVAVADGTGPKALKAAAAQAIAPGQGRGARHRRHRLAGPASDRRSQAEALVAAAGEAAICTVTPSRAPARRRAQGRHGALRQGRRKGGRRPASRRGQAIAAGVALAREYANRPANHCTPSVLADAGEEARQGVRPQGRGARPQGHREARHGLASSRSRRAATSRRSFIVMRYNGAAEGRGAGRARRQGHHLRHRRHLAQAGGRDGRDEVRHVRRGERARHAPRGRRAEACR